MAPIDVDGVAHRLEGVEADPQRKCHPKSQIELQCLHSEPAPDGADVLGREVEVFEKTEKREVGDQRADQRETLPT